jgi:hypothetical protein
MPKSPIELADVQRLARSESPDLLTAIAAFLEQPEPELEKPAPEGSITADGLKQLLASARRRRSRAQRRKAADEAWKRFLAQTDPPLPPTFQLGDLLLEIYERGGDGARRVLIDVLAKAPLRYGVWRGIKGIYKLSEARMDAEVWGLLAARFDGEMSTYSATRDVSTGTLVYLRRRAWRFLRGLGGSVPELYPQFAAQVLRHYAGRTSFSDTWVANHIWAHESKKYSGLSFSLYSRTPLDLVKHRAFPEAWKRSPEPLMYLLETCEANEPARFAIESLRKDFPDKLRTVTPAWLVRLSKRPLESAHDFLVETLEGSPEFHQGKLRALGLHDAVLALLTSPSQKARVYAVSYARAHAQDLSKEALADLFEKTTFSEPLSYAAAALSGRPARELGAAFLGRMLKHDATRKWADKALYEDFERKEISQALLRDLIFGENAQLAWARGYITKRYPSGEIGAGFWVGVLDDARVKGSYSASRAAVAALGELPVSSLDPGWLLTSLTREDIGGAVGEWLSKAEKLPGLDIERLKGFVFNASYRAVALAVLGNTKLVKPRDLGLGWLLALARRADPSLHEFAHRYLLEHMRPEDFADTGDRAAGIERLFSLALGDKEPEPVRVFAQTYLRCHHPTVGPEQAESKQLSLKPQLDASAYEAERIWNGLWDNRPDVRRFAVTLVRAELRRWGYQTRIYELAEADAKEVRNVAYDAMLKAGEGTADPLLTLKPEELDAQQVFALSESPKRTTREVAMELIRKHYGRLGGAERLGWLMQSADREVRLFAVRLLWEKHRPRALPPGWSPSKKGAMKIEDAGRFEDVTALRGLLRRMLFGLPPGRSGEPGEESAVKRRLSASVVKRNVIELVRDMGVGDAAFAGLVAPVLEEFTGSLAKGEWQACLSALAHLRSAHPGLALGGVTHGA